MWHSGSILHLVNRRWTLRTNVHQLLLLSRHYHSDGAGELISKETTDYLQRIVEATISTSEAWTFQCHAISEKKFRTLGKMAIPKTSGATHNLMQRTYGTKYQSRPVMISLWFHMNYEQVKHLTYGTYADRDASATHMYPKQSMPKIFLHSLV